MDIINNGAYQSSRTFAVDIARVTEGLTTGNTAATVTINDDEVSLGTGGESGGGDSA